MIVKDGKKIIPFYEDYKPVEVRRNNVRIAGWLTETKSGEAVVFENTYNDSAYIKIFGKTVEIGEGEKSPDNPYELKGVGDGGGFDLVSCGKNLFDKANNLRNGAFVSGSTIRNDRDYIETNNTKYRVIRFDNLPAGTYTFSIIWNYTARILRKYDNGEVILVGLSSNNYTFTTNGGLFALNFRNTDSTDFTDDEFDVQLELGSTATPYTPFRGMQTVHFPYILRSLPDGTCDYIEIDDVAKTAKLVQAVKRFILSPNENWAISSQDDNRTRFYFYRDLGVLGSVYNSQRCTHFQPFTSYADMSGRVRDGILFETSFFNNLVVSNNIASNVSELKTWLANNSVEINFKTTPTVTDLDYEAVKTYYPYTNIYTISTVQPTLEGKIRVWTA